MALPDSYAVKIGGLPAYFDAILAAEPPERFSYKFLEALGFTSSNDRLVIGILKELGFLNADGVPQDRYYRYMDRSQSAQVLAEGIKESYSDLFAVNKGAHKLNAEDAFNKLRTLYKGEKKDTVIKLISKTFVILCEQADFSKHKPFQKKIEEEKKKEEQKGAEEKRQPDNDQTEKLQHQSKLSMDSLQYHINIILPDTRDQAVYDAIFKSLRDHLG